MITGGVGFGLHRPILDPISIWTPPYLLQPMAGFMVHILNLPHGSHAVTTEKILLSTTTYIINSFIQNFNYNVRTYGWGGVGSGTAKMQTLPNPTWVCVGKIRTDLNSINILSNPHLTGEAENGSCLNPIHCKNNILC